MQLLPTAGPVVSGWAKIGEACYWLSGGGGFPRDHRCDAQGRTLQEVRARRRSSLHSGKSHSDRRHGVRAGSSELSRRRCHRRLRGGADTVYLACGINTLYWRLFSTPDVNTLDDLKGNKIGLTPM